MAEKKKTEKKAAQAAEDLTAAMTAPMRLA